MWKRIIYILFLYFALFSPPIAIGSVRLYMDWVIWPWALLYCLKKISSFRFFCKVQQTEIRLFFFIIIYSLLRGILGGEMETFKYNCFAIMGLIVVPFYLVDYGRQMFKSIDENVQHILFAGFVAILITLLCLSFPSIDDFFRNSVIKYRETEVGAIASYRGFGWGGQMTSHYSYVIGIIVMLGLVYSKKRWFYFVIPLAFIASLVNARTGALVAIVGLFFYFMFSKKIWASAFALVIGVLTFFFLDDLLTILRISSTTGNWMYELFYQMESISTGRGDSTFDDMRERMLYFPDDIQWLLIGNGFELFSPHQTSYGLVRSDIGFVNQLSFGGLAYVIPLYYLVFRVARTLYTCGRKDFGVFMIFAFLIINFKGSFLLSTPSFGLFIMIYYMYSFEYGKYNPAINLRK